MNKSIDQKNLLWAEAYANMDSKALSNLFTPDGEIFVEGGQILKGRDEIESKIGAFLLLVGKLESVHKTKNLWTVDGCIYEAGTYSYISFDSKKEFINGSYISVWNIINDEIFIKRHIMIEE
jgi:hypothetical protein